MRVLVLVGRVLVRARLLAAEPVRMMMMMMMLEGLEAVEVVAVGVRRRLGGAAEAAGVEDSALLGEVVEAAVAGGLALLEVALEAVEVELFLRCGLTILSSDSHARLLSTSRHCPCVNGMAPFDCCFEDGLDFHLPLAEWTVHYLELDLLAVAPVARARTLLHVPWLLPAASRVL